MFTKKQIMDAWAIERAKGTEANIALAIEIANSSLFGKKNWDGSPYITHPLTVAFNNTQSETKQIIGILHDVVEDTDWTLEDIKSMGFWDEVIDGLDAVTSRKDEKYLDFIVRCGLAGIFAIDVKLKDLDHNMKKNRAKDIGFKEWTFWKDRAYNLSYYYLLAVKQGKIESGTPIFDFVKNEPEFAQHAGIINKIMDIHSSETTRFPKTKPVIQFEM